MENWVYSWRCMDNGCKRLGVSIVSTLFCWKTKHSATNLWTSFLSPSPKKYFLTLWTTPIPFPEASLLSLKFRSHVATRNPHHQNRTGVIHGTRLMPQHCKKRSKLYKMAKKLKGALHHLSVRAYARNRIVQSTHMCERRSCWAKNPRAC